MIEKVICPYCGYITPLQYSDNANCNGVFIRCKGRGCRKIFEVIIINGQQVK